MAASAFESNPTRDETIPADADDLLPALADASPSGLAPDELIEHRHTSTIVQ